MTTHLVVILPRYLPTSTFFEKILNPLSADESGGNFAFCDRRGFGNICECCPVHRPGDIIPDIIENPAKFADGLLGTTFVTSDRNTADWG
jgi:hypothetical protein